MGFFLVQHKNMMKIIIIKTIVEFDKIIIIEIIYVFDKIKSVYSVMTFYYVMQGTAS